MKRLAIVGASGHGKVVADIAELQGWGEVVFFDDAYPDVSSLECWHVQGTCENLIASKGEFDAVAVAIGDNTIRLEKAEWLQTHGITLATLVHPNAVVSQYAQLGAGSVVMAGAVLNPFVSLGVANIINTSATIEHDCQLGDAVHISPGVNIAGGVSIGDRSWIGIGASVRQCIQIGENTVVGAGAVVVSDIESSIVVAGNPAKVMRRNHAQH